MSSAVSAPSASARITALDVLDVRFPTSEHLDGSDAMNPEPDYSAAYVVLRTDADDQLEGHALAFTTGRGNDAQAAAIATLAPHVVGRSVEEVCADLGTFARSLVHDPQLRWLGPEKGAIHMATGAVVNAAWDLAAKRAGKPVWRFLAEMSPEDLVAQVDFRWLSDALTPEEALRILRRADPGREERIARLLEHGYPAYTTTPGWLGYSDEKLARLAREAVADGFTQIKLKVGGGLPVDRR
ncbi:fuconate dehydratase, partial [Streptomyces sp. NPDC091215]